MDTERLRQFQELIALEPDDTVLRFGLGELYIERGRAICRDSPARSTLFRGVSLSRASLYSFR
jgi:hypothetical protein